MRGVSRLSFGCVSAVFADRLQDTPSQAPCHGQALVSWQSSFIIDKVHDQRHRQTACRRAMACAGLWLGRCRSTTKTPMRSCPARHNQRCTRALSQHHRTTASQAQQRGIRWRTEQQKQRRQQPSSFSSRTSTTTDHRPPTTAIRSLSNIKRLGSKRTCGGSGGTRSLCTRSLCTPPLQCQSRTPAAMSNHVQPCHVYQPARLAHALPSCGCSVRLLNKKQRSL
ncbi:hypothetical protein BC831DRAFT_448186, partial [Entophlyctis helioformis]